MEGFKTVFQATQTNSSKLESLQRTINIQCSTLCTNVINVSQQKGSKLISPMTKDDGLEFEQLSIIGRIGHGGFSEVYQAVDNRTKKEYALRLCKIDNQNYTYDRANKEIAINNTLKLIDHPNIAEIHSSKIICSTTHGNPEFSLQVVMELGICTLEDVFKKRMREGKRYTESELFKISHMLVHA